ncbi:hypothetical protein ABPG72_019935 [Tetrahymena utriculariae]
MNSQDLATHQADQKMVEALLRKPPTQNGKAGQNVDGQHSTYFLLKAANPINLICDDATGSAETGQLRFKNELSYQVLRENNGKEPIYNQEEQENIVQIKNSDDLFNSACEIFYNFDIIQQTIRNSYNSMKKRIEQVYIQEGDNI